MKNLSARKVDYSAFQELGVQVLGIAADHSFSQTPFKDSLNLPYPLLSDYPDLKVIQRYSSFQPHPSDPNRMAARRALVLVDTRGIVRWQWHGETQDFFPSELIVQKVREITVKP